MATTFFRLNHIARLASVLVAIFAATGFVIAAEKARAPAPAKSKEATALAQARQRVMNARPQAMYYYFDDSLGLKSLDEHAPEMTVLGPQCFKVEADGVVRGEVPAPVAETARRAGLPIMPLVVNPGFDRSIASALLRDPKAQERAVSYLAYLAGREDFVGWQLDLEYIDPADKALYTKFVQRAAARLHRDGRLLSIAVVPRFSDAYPDTRAAEFRTGEWGAPFDFRAIGRAVDFMVLMTYDHHSSGTPPGPVAGHAWMQAAVDYAARRVPRQKLLLGIPFYGREWVATASGTLSRSMTYGDISPLLARPGVEVQWDSRWRAPWFEFHEGPELHTVWYDDDRSYNEKLEFVRQNRLGGFAAWRLGTEDPQFWAVAAEAAKKPAARGPRRAGTSRSRAGSK
jgi:spore germination protein YaaH